jgi:hypothetical protein
MAALVGIGYSRRIPARAARCGRIDLFRVLPMTAHACKHTRKKATILPPEHGNMLRTSAIFSTDKKGPNVHEQVLFSAPTKKVNLQTSKCFFQHRQRNERNKKKEEDVFV